MRQCRGDSLDVKSGDGAGSFSLTAHSIPENASVKSGLFARLDFNGFVSSGADSAFGLVRLSAVVHS